MPPPYGAIVELLALTGQRRQEVSKLKWDEPTRNRGLGPFPVREPRTRRHTSFTCQSPRGKSSRNVGTYLFGTSGAKHFQAYSTSKRALDTLSGITGWRLHDLRRTIVSGMARLGVPPHVVDKILNHQAGTISGVAAVYQRHEFLAERKEALDRWGAHVEHIVRMLSDQNDKQSSIKPTRKEATQLADL